MNKKVKYKRSRYKLDTDTYNLLLVILSLPVAVLVFFVLGHIILLFL